MLVETVRQFMAEPIFPHEREVERLGEVPVELGKQIQKCSKERGLFAANMAEDVGGGGLDHVFVTLMDRELGKSIGGLMNELPLAMLWRDARVERFRDGTSDIQRHIISRELLRPHEA